MQSNKRYLDRLKKELFFMGLDGEQFRQVEAPVAEDNRRSIVSWSVCSGIFWIFSLLMSMNSSAYAACRTVYAVALLLAVITFVCARFLIKQISRLLLPVMYLLEMSVLGAGIGIAICQPNVRTATMIAFAVLIPAVVIDRTVIDIMLQGITILLYFILAQDVIEPDIFTWGLTNLIIFSLAGLQVGHVINKARYQRFVYEKSAREAAQLQTRYAYYDQLTGLKNRRAYMEELELLAKDAPEEYCIIMLDINGLKQTNDTLGHEAGDALITGAATCMADAFDKIPTIYRIGGDEFCIIRNGTREEAMQCLNRLEIRTAAWRNSEINGISVSYGVASSKEQADPVALAAQADRKMYEHKREYYQRRGIDRRKR